MNLTAAITDFHNEPIIDQNSKPLTYLDVFMTACDTVLDEKEKPENKMKDFKMGLKMVKYKEKCKLTIEEKARLKEKVGKLFKPVVMGRCFELLEG